MKLMHNVHWIHKIAKAYDVYPDYRDANYRSLKHTNIVR